MSFLIDSAIKVSAIVLAGWGASVLMGRRSAAVRHWVLAVSVVLAGAAPLLTPIVPSWSVSRYRPEPRITTATAVVGPSPIARVSADRQAAVEPNGQQRLTRQQVLESIWFLGSAISLSTLLVGMVRLNRVAASARPVEAGSWARLAREIGGAFGLRRPVAILQSDHPALLVTWGLSQPKILLPRAAREWTDERVRIVLRHELAHVRRGDWLIQLTAEILRSLYWFNPLLWIACRCLRTESERACDDAVISEGIEGADYASHLLDLARTLRPGYHERLPAPAMARASSLEGRIRAMLNTRINRSPVTRVARVFTVLVGLVLTGAIAGAQASFYTFSGTVLDATNRVMPNAVLDLTNTTSQAKYEIRTDRIGRFEFVGLPSGTYSLDVKLAGFSTLNETVAIAGGNVDQTLALQVGWAEESIKVTASAGESAQRPSDTAFADRAAKVDLARQYGRERVQRALDSCKASTVAVGGNIMAPTKIVDVHPRYPEGLPAAGIGGIVTLDAVIGTDGHIQDVRTLSAPNPELESATIEAVRQWEYTPTILNCTPTDVRVKITTNFVVVP